jgi:hypothetical protein
LLEAPQPHENISAICWHPFHKFLAGTQLRPLSLSNPAQPPWRWPDRPVSLINCRIFWLTMCLDCFSQSISGNRGCAYALIGLSL